MNDGVEYKEVPGFPGYRVGSDGSVWSCRTKGGKMVDTWHRMKPVKMSRHKDSYYRVAFHCGSTTKNCIIHRLVLELFVGPRPDGMVACHNDGNKENNNVSNLRWDTQQANAQDRIRHGRQVCGSSYWSAKVTEKDILEMCERRRNGSTILDLSEKYDLNPNTIRRILKGESWKHVLRDWRESPPIRLTKSEKKRRRTLFRMEVCDKGISKNQQEVIAELRLGKTLNVLHGTVARVFEADRNTLVRYANNTTINGLIRRGIVKTTPESTNSDTWLVLNWNHEGLQKWILSLLSKTA